MKKFIAVYAVLLCLLTMPVHAGETITYAHDDLTLEGYWAPANCANDFHGPVPVVLIIHQWKGLGAHEKHYADQLAAHCYDVFAIDMYGQGVRPEASADAAALSSRYKADPELSRARMQAALSYAYDRRGAAVPVAALGYCFGGTMALDLARGGVDLAAVISFHGGLGTAGPVTEEGAIKPALQIHHGALDPYVPPEEVAAFKDEMNKAQADWFFLEYADAVHSFTHEDAGDDLASGSAYNEKAAQRSWRAALDFLAENFGRLE